MTTEAPTCHALWAAWARSTSRNNVDRPPLAAPRAEDPHEKRDLADRHNHLLRRHRQPATEPPLERPGECTDRGHLFEVVHELRDEKPHVTAGCTRVITMSPASLLKPLGTPAAHLTVEVMFQC